MAASSSPPLYDDNYSRKKNMNPSKIKEARKDPNSAGTADGPNEEDEGGDDDDADGDGDGDPPPIPHGAAISEEACFLMIRSTESTNPREERPSPDPNNYSLITDDMKISTTRFDRLQKTHSSRSGSLMYPAKDCTTMMAAAHSGLRATNLTHPACLGVCGKLPRQPLQSCASSTFYPIEIYKFYHELQKMYPSRGGSLTKHTTPVNTRAQT